MSCASTSTLYSCSNSCSSSLSSSSSSSSSTSSSASSNLSCGDESKLDQVKKENDLYDELLLYCLVFMEKMRKQDYVTSSLEFYNFMKGFMMGEYQEHLGRYLQSSTNPSFINLKTAALDKLQLCREVFLKNGEIDQVGKCIEIQNFFTNENNPSDPSSHKS